MAQLADTQANALRVQFVERCFGANGHPLTKKGRILLGEGVLTKICRKEAQPRQFFLFNDILVLGHIVQDKRKYSKQQIIPLNEISVIQLADTDKIQNAWQISNSKKSFTVFAATAREKMEWVQHLARASGCAVVEGPEGRVADHAPIWTPDSMADMCMRCSKTRFSALQRRHHCRCCGLVVCAACSKKKFLLKKQSDKPLRVCDDCHDKLSHSEDTPSQRSSLLAQLRHSWPQRRTHDDGGDDDEDNEPENLQEAAERQTKLSTESPTVFYGENDVA